VPYWADPGRRQAGVINTRDGGRGVYFEDPDGHLLEILTRPYGSGGG
jgi:catechol 2,3-dioxygenase-like lactoylglutathione lyase family enzyme